MRAERERAAAAGEKPDFIAMVRGWGGVSLVYRKRLQDSPAYRLNHEEVAKALEEGIAFTENMNPVEAVPDEYGHVKAMIFTRADGSSIELPARTVLVAAGTVPNIIYEKEHPGTFALDDRQKFFQGFKAVRERTGPTASAGSIPARAGSERLLHLVRHDGKFISYYGDNHPRYTGNVVKAMASAKHGYPHVVELFADQIAALDPAAAAGTRATRGRRWSRRSTTSCSRASSASSG